ncbi:hypothetical protein GCM10025783_23120 [Amnibacterium soli]|uniref:Lipoprotein n=1 Tax=Amnibacterium soli TaxID=1282736 RepID=A0ABP8Z938_9MICO
MRRPRGSPLPPGVALAGCSFPTAPAPRATTLPGVSVRVVQYRSDIPLRHVQLEVVNGSARTVVVAAASLRGAGWSPAPHWSDDDPAEIRAGTTVDLPAALTTASCEARSPLSSARLRLPDGSTRTVRAEDSHGTLARLHEQACFAQAATSTATIVFQGFRPEGRTAEILLDVRGGPDVRRGLVVEQVLPTTLLSPRSGDETWRVDRRLAASGTVRLPAAPTRCDLHAVAEDKVGTVLPVQVRLADGRKGTIDAVAPKALKDRVLAWVVRACGNT